MLYILCVVFTGTKSGICKNTIHRKFDLVGWIKYAEVTETLSSDLIVT